MITTAFFGAFTPRILPTWTGSFGCFFPLSLCVSSIAGLEGSWLRQDLRMFKATIYEFDSLIPSVFAAASHIYLLN